MSSQNNGQCLANSCEWVNPLPFVKSQHLKHLESFHSLNFNEKVQPDHELHSLPPTHFLAARTFAHLRLTAAAIAALPAALIFLFAGFTSDLAGASAVFPALTLAQ